MTGAEETESQPPASPIFVEESIPGSKTYNGRIFPLLLTPPNDAPILRKQPDSVTSYLQKHRTHIFSLLQKHSVIYFRDFAASDSTPEDFANFVISGLGLAPFPYALGNAVRTPIVGDIVFTANEAPPDRLIPFHHELAQTPKYPTYILFYSAVCAETGGETPVCFSPAVYDSLSKSYPDFLQLVEEHGVVYSRRMTRRDRSHSAIGRGWASTFNAGSRAEAEDVLRARGYSWRWEDEGEDADLSEISPVLKAVVETRGRKAFFNQVFAAWFGWRDELNIPSECIRAGNGDTLDARALDGLQDIMNMHEVAVPWRRGDFVLIDNMQAMHSRRSFSGKRVVLASLAD